jgi:hypothetical protein
MNHLKFDLGQLRQGAAVSVTLDHRANVRLLDPDNYEHFRQGRQHRCIGGHATTSPYRLRTPSAGHWIVVVDLGGGAGNVRASVTVAG